MRVVVGSYLLLAVAVGCAKTPRPDTSGSSAGVVAIRGTTVVDVLAGVLRRRQTVVVEGVRITVVAPVDGITIPADAEVIEAEGTFLIPGLWDMHVHSIENAAWDTDIGSVAAREWHFPLFLAWGVTGVRNMNDGTGDPKLTLTNSIKRQLAAGIIDGPRLVANGPTVDGDPPFSANPVIVRNPDEARAVVDQLVDSGADFIKVYENVPRDAYFALMDQARRRTIPVDGHVPFRVTPEEAADAGQRTFEHVLAMAAGCSTGAASERERLDGIVSPTDRSSGADGVSPLTFFQHERVLYDSRDPAACAPTIAAYRRNGVAEAPSIISFHDVARAKELVADPDRMRMVPRAIRDNWATRVQSAEYETFREIVQPMAALYSANTRLLHEAGVLLLAATDVGIPILIPGLSLHEELEHLVAAGLTPAEALQTATINPARVLGLADSLGTIEPGKLADLVLLDADPLVDIRHTRRILAVVANGRLYRRADLERLLAVIDAIDRRGDRPAE